MLLNLKKFIETKELDYITTSNIMIGEQFDPNGLFSNKIFGLTNSKRWRNTFAAISLNCEVLHPLLFEIADRRCSALLKLLSGDLSVLNGEIVTGNSGEWGLLYFSEHTKEAVDALLKSKLLTNAGATLCRYIVKNRKNSMISDVLVLPPQYRPIHVEHVKIDMHEINEKYIAIINEAQVILNTQKTSSSYNSIAWRIQQQVYGAYMILRDMIKGKTGLQRKSLLGKTMDFSGRAVIVGDPYIPPDSIGLPFKIAVAMFKPFIIYESTHQFAEEWQKLGVRSSVMVIGHLIDSIKEGKKTIAPEIKEEMKKIVDYVTKDRVVIAKRDPSLHRLSLRAFKPIIVDDDSIHINPLLTDGFNADFDGDQMAVYLPLTEKAQMEAKQKMMVSKTIFGPSGRDLAIVMKNDVVFGVYCLTANPNKTAKKLTAQNIHELEALMIHYSDPTIPVTYKSKETTLGRAIVSDIVGVPVEKQWKKKDITNVFVELAEKEEPKVVMEKMDELMRVAMIAPTLMGKAMTATSFTLPPHLEKEKNDAIKSSNPAEALSKVTKDVLAALKESDSIIFDLVDSGARGNVTNVQATIVAKGYVEDIDGSVIDKPVKSSLNDGLTSAEYFSASVGGRKGVVDRSQMTAISGYLSRQMVYALASVKADSTVKHCGTKRFLELEDVSETMAKAIQWRYLSSGELIEDPSKIVGKNIKIFSPMYCTSPKLCHHCLGEKLLDRLDSNNIGILAAQLLGERGTQLTMRTFHTGGAGKISNFVEADSKLDDIVQQDGNDIITKKAVQFIFKEEDIRGGDSNEYLVQSFFVKTDKEELEINIDYDFTIIVPNKDSLVIKDDTFIVSYEENMICGSMKNSSQGVTGAIAEISKILSGRMFTNDALVKKIFDLYSTSATIPLWPVEILASQLARNPEAPQFPWRLSGFKESPLRVPIKQVALLENWRRGAAFENVSNAFHTAILTNAEDNAIASDLDNLLNM